MGKYVNDNYNEKRLEFEFNYLGFSYWAVEALRARLADPNRQNAFAIQDERWFGPDKMHLTIELGDGNNAMLGVKSYDVSYRKEIIVPEIEIEGINTATLDRIMGSYDWSEDLKKPEVREAAKAEPYLQQLVDLYDGIKQDLQRLKESDQPAAWEAAHLLTLRHWLDTPYESNIPGAEEFKNIYEIRHSFSPEDKVWPTVKEAKNLLEGAPIGRSIISPVDGIPVVEWFGLNLHEKGVDGNYLMEGFGFFDLEREMKYLPIRERYNHVGVGAIYRALLNGDRPAVFFLEGNSETPANLHINPISQYIEVRDKQGKIITNSADLSLNDQTLGDINYSTILNNKVMRNSNYNEANYEYIVGRLRQHLFPDTQNAELMEQMKQGKSRILLEFHSAEYSGAVKATVHIEKADSGTYFPNRYQLELKRPDSEYVRRQYFPIQNFKGHGNQYDIPWKMGVNLLKGSQVLNNWLREDGSTIYEWRGLDFSQRKNAGYGYLSFDRQELDVEKKLDELPIQEKNKNDLRHSHVVRSIEMGNSQVVHLDMEGNPTIRLRANVRRGDLDIITPGQAISIQQFNTELTQSRESGVYMSDPSQGKGTGRGRQTGMDETASQVNSRTAKEQPITQGSSVSVDNNGKTNMVQNTVNPPGSKSRQTATTRPVNDGKTKKVLTGNRITPPPVGRSGNHMKHGM
ncbi:MAG: hypothetical protein BGO55_06260 [Sphingobacteriales bacterium 50-39]|nr:hypothetical protein [Sphingobacteriales bacterium]OJW52866.1 MAG: hypothetical protein BGO55_06260 [Sphingobacteriales bacterium 50-39]